MKITPLTGQVLIEILPPDNQSAGGILFPDERPLDPEAAQESSRNPEKPSKNNIGIVRRIGAWPKLSNGMAVLPEFGKGAKVVFNAWHGTAITHRGVSYRMVNFDSVLAVLT